MLGRIGHRSAHSLARRSLYALRNWLLGGVGKGQAVYFVDYRGQRYKRIVFGDSRQAELVATALSAVAAADAFPRLVLWHEREIWVEFVAGRKIDVADPGDIASLAAFFARLYQDAPISGAARDLDRRLQIDLWFLERAGVLSTAEVQALKVTAQRLLPEQVLFGFDYTDPVAKNFIVADGGAAGGGLKAIDVESLQMHQPLGTGIAKAALHWPDFDASAFVDQVVVAGAPDFTPQYAYVELCLLAGWTKRKLLTGKRRYVQPLRFDKFMQPDS